VFVCFCCFVAYGFRSGGLAAGNGEGRNVSAPSTGALAGPRVRPEVSSM